MMKICASLGSADDVRSGDLEKADIIEIRTDIFGTVPENVLRKGQTGLISFKEDVTAAIPKGWMADIGSAPRSSVRGVENVISSYHDHNGTPCVEDIMKIFNGMDGNIVKGAFKVNSVKDVMTLFDASRTVGRRHVILGMGELGRITRIRQERMENEFTFAYVGKPTAPGQMSVPEMREIGDNGMITGIVGSGIGYTRSPAMHDAAFRHLNINGKYLIFDTPSLDRIGDLITEFCVKGVNITKPYKTDIIEYVDKCDNISEKVGAVNTVVNDNGKLTGYNTDVHGIEAALRMNSVDVSGKRVLMLGSGGAARACAYLLSENNCETTITGRNSDAVRQIASEFSLTSRERTSVAVKGYDVIINCIPLNRNNDRSEYPIKIEQIDGLQTVFDMVYGGTHLNDVAEERGCRIVRGEDMLVCQGMRSFELFTSMKAPFEIMRCAV